MSLTHVNNEWSGKTGRYDWAEIKTWNLLESRMKTILPWEREYAMRRAEHWDKYWASVSKACVGDNKQARETKKGLSEKKEVSQERFIG